MFKNLDVSHGLGFMQHTILALQARMFVAILAVKFGCQPNSQLPLGKMASVFCSSLARLPLCIQRPECLLYVFLQVSSFFGLVVAHAPIEAAPDTEKDVWWDSLQSVLRSLPRRAVPVLFIDGNARLDTANRATQVHSAVAVTDNARRLQNLGTDTGLHSAPLFTQQGTRVITWTSPAGKDTQLDYIMLPENLASTTVTIGSPVRAYEHPGVDHWPMIVRVRWQQPAKGNRPSVTWDRRKMKTAEGRRLLQQIHDTVPSIPWTFHVEDHLQLINNHVFAGLCQHFQAGGHQARHTHVSEEQWHAIRTRRHVRRLAARSRKLRCRELLSAVFIAWRCQSEFEYTRPQWYSSGRRRCAKAMLSEARLARLIRKLNGIIQKLSARDVAQHTRGVLASARQDGPAAMYQALRGVMRTGRRYKPPLLLPAIQVRGTIVADPVEVQSRLTEHFATPEHGSQASVIDVVHIPGREGTPESPLTLASLPSVSSIAMSFLTMQDNKASGISTIPCEAYRYAALEAARSHATLYVKMAARGQWPMLWRGVMATAIPKPHKNGAFLGSWRSIALAEAAAKGIGRSIRVQLATRLKHFATPGQHGSLPGQNIGIPSHQVLAYLQLAQKKGLSTAAVFLDGRSAYYATVREYLFAQELDDERSLRGLLDLLIPDTNLHDEAVAALVGPGLLQEAGIPAGLQGFLREHLQGTWFTLQPCPLQVQHTKSGTTPGSPLADILFQFVQTSFMRNVMCELEEHGLQAQISVSSDAFSPQGWADDVAVVLPMSTASEIEHRLRVAVPILDRQSRLMGIDLNYDVGKTEALVCFRGAHSVVVRRRLLSADIPCLDVTVSDCRTACLRLVERYTHLGNVITCATSCLEDVQSKSAAAMPVLRRLRRTLLRNAELTAAEKVHLTASLVLAKVEFGAGLWCPRTHAEKEAVNTAMARPWRAVCRRIYGCSTKFLDDAEVFAILEVPSACESVRICRVRHLLAVVAEGPGFLWQCIQEAQDWLELAWADALEVLKATDSAAFHEISGATCSLQRLSACQQNLRQALKKYRQHCVGQKAAHRQAAMTKAADIARCEAKGGVVFRAPANPCGQFVCGFCPMRFVTRANRAAHQSTVHGLTAEVASAAGTTCNVCRVEWWTTHRLREHLRRSDTCRNTYCSADLGTASRHENVGSKKDKAFKPPLEVQGPLPWWATLRPPAMSAEMRAVTTEACQDAQSKLRNLAGAFECTPFHEWAPRAFAWLRCYSLEALTLEDTHVAFWAFKILSGIAEHADSSSTVACPGYLAIKRGSLWWVEPT